MKLNTSKRKRFRVSNKVKKVASVDRFRLSISRSSKNIFAQIIDDNKRTTLISASSIEKDVKTSFIENYTPKGFVRPIGVFRVDGFTSKSYMKDHIRLSHKGKRIEINVIDSSDIRAAIEELKSIQEGFEKELREKDK